MRACAPVATLISHCRYTRAHTHYIGTRHAPHARPRRLDNLHALLEAALDAGVPGDFIETGAWRGGACILAAAVFQARGQLYRGGGGPSAASGGGGGAGRRVFVADSFRGIPPVKPGAYPADAVHAGAEQLSAHEAGLNSPALLRRQFGAVLGLWSTGSGSGGTGSSADRQGAGVWAGDGAVHILAGYFNETLLAADRAGTATATVTRRARPRPHHHAGGGGGDSKGEASGGRAGGGGGEIGGEGGTGTGGDGPGPGPGSGSGGGFDRFAVLRLDGDTYESTHQALRVLYPRLSVGGYVIVDDFMDWAGARQATLDYRSEHGIGVAGAGAGEMLAEGGAAEGENLVAVYHAKGEIPRGVWWQKLRELELNAN